MKFASILHKSKLKSLAFLLTNDSRYKQIETTMRYICLIVVTLIFTSCTKDSIEANTEPINNSNQQYSHIKYFGFALIDTYWDDPNDGINKTIYNDEVHTFSNIADILVVNPTDDIITRITDMNNLEMKPYLHISELFFELVGTSGPSGASYDLRPDYQSRWDTFVATNNLTVNFDKLQALYLGEEPTWNDVSFSELQLASDYIKSSIPEVPIMIIEAYPSIDNLQIPTSVDWIGFDHYFIKNPLTNVQFLAELSSLKSKFSTNEQKLVVVMDTHYIPWAHGGFGGISQIEMKDVATNYFNLACKEPLTIAIIGYTWPSGFDSGDMIGARELDTPTKVEYQRIGKLITKKP